MSAGGSPLAREIGVVTVARSDFGIYLPVLRALDEHPALIPRVLVTGMHLSPAFGLTVQQIERSPYPPFRRVESLDESNTQHGAARTIGRGVQGFADLFATWRPDILMVLGDRFDMLPAPVAALPFGIPVAHLHGGEVTEGAIDESIRHAITKLSHLHFVTTETYASRVRQLGEEPWRITVAGAPGLDNFRLIPQPPRAETLARHGLDAGRPLVLVTMHTVTTEPGASRSHARALCEALAAIDAQFVVTAPNADPEHEEVRAEMAAFVAAHADRARWVENAGQEGYVALLAAADAMAGNSSSGIIESGTVALPVVNVGDRQRGRVRGSNVIDCAPEREAIEAALRRAISVDFREGLQGMQNPYGDGQAAERIAQRLAEVELGGVLTTKRFVDLVMTDIDQQEPALPGAAGGGRGT